MSVIDGADAQKHEDDALGPVAQHLQTALDGGEGRRRNIFSDVILHGNAAEHDTGKPKAFQVCKTS